MTDDTCRGCDDPWCDDCAPTTDQCDTCGAHLNLNGLCHYCDATWVWPHQAVTLHPHPHYL